MKKYVLFIFGTMASALVGAQAQNTVIFGSYDDWTNNFSGNGGYTVEPVSTFNYGDITENGIGNPTAPGATSGDGAGALQVNTNFTWSEWSWGMINSPGPTTAVLQALDGPSANYGGSLVNQSGTIYVYYTRPDDDISGSYWNGMMVCYNYDNNWGFWPSSSEVDLGPVSTPSGTEEMYEAIIPYTINATTLSYFGWGFDENSDYTTGKPWYICSLQAAPLPQTIIPAPVTPLFITGDDFSEWNSAGGDLVQEDTSWSESNNITDGLGNTNTPGATGTAGSLIVYWNSNGAGSGFGSLCDGPNEQGNNSFMQAIDPGCNVYTATAVPAYGEFLIDFSYPDSSLGGNYFEFGVGFTSALNGYSWWNNFNNSVFFLSGTKDLGYKDNNGDEVYEATIPYVIGSGNYYGFTPSIFVNSNYQPANPFHISNISVSASQAPLITSVSLSGNQLALSGVGGLTGFSYNVLSTTNLTNPVWKPVANGISFNGPNWSTTNTISAQAAYYEIQTVAP